MGQNRHMAYLPNTFRLKMIPTGNLFQHYIQPVTTDILHIFIIIFIFQAYLIYEYIFSPFEGRIQSFFSAGPDPGEQFLDPQILKILKKEFYNI